ncbi:DUF4097 family beta strand repeat-containing protein [Saccharothrix coeruleofusca]|uniref:DUF4097 domain-containing protein n=1 Tax=Saccharothrix coeruleofusca TaxID=33919 RepID=A0A918ECX2_9PSEU|nr:DUF4097 family beta strand repeat-containing protein [Saccharothrix coeruleofusca]GGP53387.1 hypothetical protein GCM10010185_26910 [Saccharothrix coeruleofusca]
MHEFPTPSPISVVLDVPAGRVRFIAADRPDTAVEVLPADAAKDRDVKAAQRTAVDYRDGVLRITTPTGNRLLSPGGAVEVTVGLPAGSHVEAEAAAEVRGVGRLGEVAVTGAYGAIKLDEAAGAHLTTAAGDITVGRLTGPARISTDQGDIDIAEATRGTLVLRTQAGQVRVGAATGVSASLDAGTGHGRIHNSLTNTGGAAPQLAIHATTAHGDITARSL